MKNLLIILTFLFIGQQSISAQTTKIWVVRHAEKDLSDPKDKDPDLSPEGKERAQALAKYLKGESLDSIFSTNYKRTKLTGYPTADKIGLAIKIYDPAKQKEFAEGLIKNAKGKKMLIIGHSNTVQEILVAFGVAKPVKELTDDDYDYIFLLTLKGDKKDVKVDRYGLAHHAKE
ncbi:histidine phosphatase family protein [Pedobacter sp. Du54]|uniref:histidine phosphatase family protein n=1 Tax=Pedobacter anseongensis TaxID=3133439 RepID=UPI0030A303C8